MRERFKPREVDRSELFAARFVSRITIIIIASAVVGALIVASMLERDLSKGYAEAIFSISEASGLLTSTVIYSVLFQILIAIPILAIVVILVTHKVVGPMYRFSSIFREVAVGELRNTSRIRQKDHLRSTMESINDMKTDLLGFIESCDEKSGNIGKMLERLEKASESDKGEIVRELREEAAALGNLTEQIKTAESGSGGTD
ncbi:MAG: hypothetical protein ACE5EN_05160 [Nitrospinota bacterium]